MYIYICNIYIYVIYIYVYPGTLLWLIYGDDAGQVNDLDLPWIKKPLVTLRLFNWGTI